MINTRFDLILLTVYYHSLINSYVF